MRSAAFIISAAIALCFDARGESVYFVGNSLTQDVGFDHLASFAGSRGHTFAAGRHVDLGARLAQIYEWRRESPQAFPPYGSWSNALANYSWDALALEPFVDSLSAATATINAFAAEVPASTAKFIYQVWPAFEAGDYAANWEHGYTPDQNYYTFSRDYYRQLMAALPGDYRIIPAGEVLYEVDAAIKAGQLPGIDSITDLYWHDACTCHLNPTGYIAVNATIYATLFQESPVGLSVPSEDPATVAAIQQIAWDVVTTHHGTGVAAPSSYEAWKRSYSKGLSDAAGYTAWRNSQPGEAAISVPEPATGAAAIAAIALLSALRYRGRFG